MPSLYKGVAVDAVSKVNIPVAEVKTALLQMNPGDELFEKATQIMAEALFLEKWKSAQFELAIERGRMLAEVEVESERARALAEREGFEAGVSRAQAEANILMLQVRESYTVLAADRVQFIEDSRNQIVDLVVTTTEHFMHEQMQRVPELLLNMVARAIQELMSRRKVCIFVNPNRVETVSAYSYLLPGTADGKEILIRPDPSLDIESFRVEDDSGAIAASLTEHLKIMRQVLADD
ncbi:MAG: FliH/SctL family protein [Bacillota bacterium]|nr:FliH/SctL family protein [Bacillota bacterium]